jgi:hypothetical protein
MRWDIKRLEAYNEFASVVDRFIGIAWRISAGLGLPAGAHPLDAEIDLSVLAEAGSRIGSEWNKILLLGSPSTILAAKNWHEEAIRLEFFARRLLTDPEEFTKATWDRREARRRFFSAARVDLNVTSGKIPREVDAPAGNFDVLTLRELIAKSAAPASTSPQPLNDLSQQAPL